MVPCHTLKCMLHIDDLDYALDSDRGWYNRRPDLAIVSFSNRPSLSALTRPSLERFCAQYPGRYDLFIEDEPLLDDRDWHPAWNKIALVKRAFLMGSYDAVIWIDDDVLITNFV